MQLRKAVAAIALMPLITMCSSRGTVEPVVRLGYFPNVTHAQAVLGVKRGSFQETLGESAKLQTALYSAGPSVIESIYANNLDMAYVGPSPIINGFVQSKGEEIRVVAGAANNGVLIIGSAKRGIRDLQDLRGKRIASPQLGNTQDISARDFVVNHLGTQLKERGGDTEVVPIANSDIENLFSKNQLDAAWVPEPWGSRIISKGFATLLTHEKDLWPEKIFTLTNVIVRRKFLEQHPDLVQKMLEAHINLTEELQHDPAAVAEELNQELKRLTTKDLPVSVMTSSLENTDFSYDIETSSFRRFFEMGQKLGLVPGASLDLEKLIEQEPLEAAKNSRKVPGAMTSSTVETNQ